MDHKKKGQHKKGRPQRPPSRPAVHAAPLALTERITLRAPNIRVHPSGDTCIVRHNEYVRDVAGSVAFSVNRISIQPGLATLFPWLCNFAQRYEKYRFKKLHFHLSPLKAASNNGVMMLAVDVDSLDSIPACKSEMMNLEGASRSSIWSPCTYNQRTSAFQFPWYMLRGGSISSSDLKTYDCGQLLFASFGCADTSDIAELWVDYEIELSVPQLSISSWGTNSAKVVQSSSTWANIFGSNAVVTGGLDVSVATNTVTINKVGRYILQFVFTGSSLVSGSLGATSTGTISSYGSPAYINAAGTTAVAIIHVFISAVGQTLTLPAAASTLSACTLYVGLYDSSLD